MNNSRNCASSPWNGSNRIISNGSIGNQIIIIQLSQMGKQQKIPSKMTENSGESQFLKKPATKKAPTKNLVHLIKCAIKRILERCHQERMSNLKHSQEVVLNLKKEISKASKVASLEGLRKVLDVSQVRKHLQQCRRNGVFLIQLYKSEMSIESIMNVFQRLNKLFNGFENPARLNRWVDPLPDRKYRRSKKKYTLDTRIPCYTDSDNQNESSLKHVYNQGQTAISSTENDTFQLQKLCYELELPAYLINNRDSTEDEYYCNEHNVDKKEILVENWIDIEVQQEDGLSTGMNLLNQS